VILSALAAPPDIHRVPARQLARRELARSLYQTPWWQRVLRTVLRWLNQVTGHPTSGWADWWSVLAVLIAIVVIIAAGRYLGGARVRARRKQPGGLLSGTRLTAGDYREKAARLATAGSYGAAIVEQVRAIATDLESRGILPPRPGRTAFELAAEAAVPLPGSAAALRSAALLFDDVRYGGRDGTEPGYDSVRRLDEAIQATRAAVVPG
jgi:hypothetical protein